MKPYSVSFLPKALRQLAKLPAAVQVQVRSRVSALAACPRPQGCVKLTSRDEYRIRIGSYRVVYQVHDKTVAVIVVGVGDRKSIYK